MVISNDGISVTNSGDHKGHGSSTDAGGHGSSTDVGGHGSSTYAGGHGSSTYAGGHGSSTYAGGHGSSMNDHKSSNKQGPKYGVLKLIIGSMFSGKSSELIRRFKRYTIGGKKCVMVKYKQDVRYDEKTVTTHDNTKVNAIPCQNLYEIDGLIKEYDVICIDEVQFYKDANIFCDKWANQGKIVEACGLNGTFERKPFHMISLLIPLAEDITYLTAVCKETGSDAHYSKRLTDETAEEVIGGSEKYTAASRETFFEGHNKDGVVKNFAKFVNLYVTDNDIKLTKDQFDGFVNRFDHDSGGTKTGTFDYRNILLSYMNK